MASWWKGGGGGGGGTAKQLSPSASPDRQLAAYRLQQQKQKGESGNDDDEGSSGRGKPRSLLSVAKAFLATRRRLRLDPDKSLYFLYEPGKQVSSAIRIKNTSRSPVAFKFQTNAPKSCFMRPPSGILAPGESIITSVVKFIEQPEPNQEKNKCTDKFKILSLKVKQGTEFTPDLFEERKESIAIERVLQVVFLDPQGKSPQIEKLRKRIAEAEAAQEEQKNPTEEKIQKTAAAGGGGGVLDEWKEQQREKRLAKQQAEGVDSL